MKTQPPTQHPPAVAAHTVGELYRAAYDADLRNDNSYEAARESHEAHLAYEYALARSQTDLMAALETTTRLLALLNAPGANDPIEAAVYQARAALSRAKL